MLTRSYGSTGVEVSAIGFGGMRFPDQKNVTACVDLVHYAYEKGITYFDTAPGYGDSEVLYGSAFKEMVRTRQQRPFQISSKTMRSQPEEIRRECEQSLERMGVDCIDFYHVWCVLTPEHYDQRKADGALREFEKLKEEGLIKHIVVSSHMTGQEIGGMLADYPFAGVLLGYSVMNFPYREAALEAAARHGQGVVVMNPLGGGMIPQHPERFDFVKTSPEDSVVTGALKFLLNDPRITLSLVGFSSPEEVDEAVQAVESFKPLDAGQIEAIRNQLSGALNALCTGCGYCDSCPQGVPVPKLMDACNQQVLAGKPQAVLDRLKWHWGIPPESDLLRLCNGCGACESVCTQKLNVVERLQNLRELADQVVRKEEEPSST